MAVYAEAARRSYGTPETAVRAEYWFVSAKRKFKRIGYPVTAAVLDRVGQTLAATV